LLAVGAIDVGFNVVVGSVLYWELPKQFTFSQRCCQHLTSTDWRGKVAGAFSVPLNAIFPNHIHPV